MEAMKMANESKLGNHVSVDLDRLNHIHKHGLKLDIEQIIKIADDTKGIEGMHIFHNGNGEAFRTIVIRGTFQNEGKEYGIFRTMWVGNSGSNQKERNGLRIIDHYSQEEIGCKIHGVIPYTNGLCPFCDLK